MYCKKRANVYIIPETYTRKMLFYINKKNQSDYIIPSQNSRSGSYTRPYMVLKDVLWSQWSRDYYTLHIFVCMREIQYYVSFVSVRYNF